MVFSVSGDGSVQVNDGIIQTENGGPMAAKVTSNDEKRIILTWSLDVINPSMQTTRMAYRASFERASNKIRVSAKPSGYANDFEGRGTCTQK